VNELDEVHEGRATGAICDPKKAQVIEPQGRAREERGICELDQAIDLLDDAAAGDPNSLRTKNHIRRAIATLLEAGGIEP
jgi:hypothetical protein